MAVGDQAAVAVDKMACSRADPLAVVERIDCLGAGFVAADAVAVDAVDAVDAVVVVVGVVAVFAAADDVAIAAVVTAAAVIDSSASSAIAL